MNRDTSKTLSRAGLFAGTLLALWSSGALAQGVPQITRNIDETQRITLHGNTPSSANASNDQGRVNASEAANHMLLVLQRSDAQEAELQKLISSQHDPKSPSYHQWLKPAEFGAKFGIGDSDTEVVKAWLQAKGFTVNKTNAARTMIDFSGTAGQVESAFHTELHTYMKKGVTFHANSKDPEIPAALASVVKGFAALNDIKPNSFLISRGRASFDPATHKGSPQWNDPICGKNPAAGTVCEYYLPTPADIATQYSLTPLYKSGFDGKGVTIGIISTSNVDLSNVLNYRKFFHVANPNNLPATIIDGEDPGQNGAAEEAYLDVEASGALAPAATIDLYTSADTITTSGLFTAMVRAIEDDQADVLSMSYGACEKELGAAGNQFFYYAWQQAAAQGQSVFVSSGDSGSAGCDRAQSETTAQFGLGVSGFASTPYNVAVGGTDFYYSDLTDGLGSTALNSQLRHYWGAPTTDSASASLITPVPEQAWNDFIGQNLVSFLPGVTSIASGSGGQSSCSVGTGADPVTGAFETCTSGYPRPSWQRGVGVPNDGRRNLPDVSLFSADGANLSAWPVCIQAQDCTDDKNDSGSISVTGVGGTSAASPAMAGIMALVDQSQGGRQGNPNVIFYALAQQYPDSFNDVTVGNNSVLCYPNSPNCSLDKNGDGLYTTQKYSATVGYDAATGLGSVNGANLIANWKKIKFLSTSTAMALSSTTLTHGAPVEAYVSVFAPKGTPTGTASLTTNSTTPTQSGQGVVTLTNGTGSAPFYLPGGSYDVYANYSGDGQFSASESSPVSVSIAPEPSITALTAFAAERVDTGGYAPVQITNGSTFPYGFTLSFDAAVSGKSGQGTPTGTVSYVDSAVGPQTIASANLNSYGIAEFNTFSLGAGRHSIRVSYNGDPSFKATPTGVPPTTVSFTISKGTAYVYTEDVTAGPVLTGQPFAVPIIVGGSNGLAPTGKATVTFGSQVQQVTLIQTIAEGHPLARGTALFTNLAPGLYPVAVQYGGDSNYNAASSFPQSITVTKPKPSLLRSFTTLTSSTLNAGNDGDFTLTATVTGNVKVPLTGNVFFYLNGEIVGYVPLSHGRATVTYSNYNLLTGTNRVTAEYTNDLNYDVSTSAPLTIKGNEGDFTIATSNPNLKIAAGQTATASLLVSSLQGLSGTVLLQCATSSPSVACSINSPSVNLSPYGKQSAAAVTIYAAGGAAPQKQAVTITASDAGVVHNLSFNVILD